MSQFPKGKNFHKPITQNQNPTKNPISNFLPLSTQFQFSMSQIPISKTKKKKNDKPITKKSKTKTKPIIPIPSYQRRNLQTTYRHIQHTQKLGVPFFHLRIRRPQINPIHFLVHYSQHHALRS